ncbi:DUF2809 domain-containing protein [Mucilaginibacter sp.]|uniref:ribosomal maturation YjgA family protein n=1 Tax=Mucilaginibacter sp. TaxID=1882438 RepID=UPI00284AA5DD|nr:DUF2809 domain-containing protein [Mucilaginibacter sp.]MDR3694944.1 DUF2809 domain-containing protein [Mucilaginibacter sp.]
MQSTFIVLKFHIDYFIAAFLLFISEIIIALYLHDSLIRPYGGDFLVVILIYCFVKSFFNLPVLLTAGGVLLFAYTIEVSQYFHLIRVLGLENSRLAKVLLGTSFSFTDLLVYTLGIILVIVAENLRLSLQTL